MEIPKNEKTLAERLEAAAAAYPEDVFPPPTAAERIEHGRIIQAAAAAMGRHMAPMLLEAARAVREAGACVRDAERFRWMASQEVKHWVGRDGEDYPTLADAVDAAIQQEATINNDNKDKHD
jgi:hypothetical protein